MQPTTSVVRVYNGNKCVRLMLWAMRYGKYYLLNNNQWRLTFDSKEYFSANIGCTWPIGYNLNIVIF